MCRTCTAVQEIIKFKMTKRTITHAQAARLQAARSKSPRGEPDDRHSPAMVITAEDRERVLGLFTDDDMTLDHLHDLWLERYEPRQHLRWWITAVLAHLNDRSQVSIRFDDERPLWSLIQI